VLGEQIVQHARVLHADEGAEHAEHSRWRAQIDANAIRVASARTRACADDELMVGKVSDDFVDQRKDRSAPAIDDALTADLHDVRSR
jgi:hypothetical protein